MKEIYLAGGCFWGVEGYFAQLDGVVATRVGYANGQTEETSYALIGATDHAETVRITYAPERISLQDLLRHYLRMIDPFSVNRQGHDVGRQYRTGIYYTDPADVACATQFLEAVAATAPDRQVAVELAPLAHFIDAEDYHQSYLQKNPQGYCHVDLSLARQPLDS